MSIINDALKKAQATKESLPFGHRGPNAGVELEFQKKKGVNWGPIFVLLVLFLISGPIIAPLFTLPLKNTAPVSFQTAKSSGEEASQTHKSQFGIEETPRLPLEAAVPVSSPSALVARPNFNLSGIVYNPEEAYCIINDKIIKVGDQVGGAKLVSITPEKVVLDYQGEIITLVT